MEKLASLTSLPEGVAVLSLGGNLGDVAAAFETALRGLSSRGFELFGRSSSIKTAPEGCEPGAPDFLNAVAIGFWPGSPRELLAACKELEAAAGRPNEHPKWVSRRLDMDIVAFGSLVLEEEGLLLPHPLAMKRRFVLAPLAELAPDLRIPGSSLSAAEALRVVA